MWRARFDQYVWRGGWSVLAATGLLAAIWTAPALAQPKESDPNTPTVQQQENRRDRDVKQDERRSQPGRIQTPESQPGHRDGGNRVSPPVVTPSERTPGTRDGVRYLPPVQPRNPESGERSGWQRRVPVIEREPEPQPGDGNRYRTQPVNRGRINRGDSQPPPVSRPPADQGEEQVNPPRHSGGWDQVRPRRGVDVQAPPSNDGDVRYRTGLERGGRPGQGEGGRVTNPMPPVQPRVRSGEGRLGDERPPLVPIGRVNPTPKVEIERSQSRVWKEIGERIRERNESVPQVQRRVPPDRLQIRRPDGRTERSVLIDRSRHPIINRTFVHIRSRFGSPGFGYNFIPRPTWAYREGYRDGFRDGRHWATRYRSSRPVFLFFYSSFYFDDPFYIGFSYPGYHPNIYFYYGWVPRWHRAPSIIVLRSDPYPIVYGGYSRGPAYYYGGSPRVDETGVARAMADIRHSWLDGDIDRFSYHLREGENISVYFDTEYSYSLGDQDYYSMTLDAMSTIDTISMEFDEPTWINQNEVYFTGRHVFTDPDGERQTVYVSYRLHRYSGHWYIIAVGSSPNPIDTPYRDFRYRR